MYTCKHCGRPIEATIEGECVCLGCWSQEVDLGQEDIAWLESHCMDCGKPVRGGGYCPECQQENEQVMADLLLEHQGQIARVHWRGPGPYIPIAVLDDDDIIYYHVNDNPWDSEEPVDGWPTIMAKSWDDFQAALNEDGVHVVCLTGQEGDQDVSEGDL